MAVQWVDLGPGGLLVASAEKAWIQRPQPAWHWSGRCRSRSPPRQPPDTCSPPIRTPPEPARRRDRGGRARHAAGCTATDEPALGLVACQPVLQRPPHRAAAWQKRDPLRRVDRADLAEFAATRLDGEQGHDRFPLNDLRALGYDAGGDGRRGHARPGCIVEPRSLRHRRCVRGASPSPFSATSMRWSVTRSGFRMDSGFFAALDDALGLRPTRPRLCARTPPISTPTRGRGDRVSRRADARRSAGNRAGCFRTAQIRRVALPIITVREHSSRPASHFEPARFRPRGGATIYSKESPGEHRPSRQPGVTRSFRHRHRQGAGRR